MWSSRAYWQYVIIDTGNDLAPNRRQAIAWTNYGLVWDAFMAHGFHQFTKDGVVFVQCQGII